LEPIDKASPYLQTPEFGDRIQSLKRRVLIYEQDDVLDKKNRKMGNFQKHNI
jgi:hypothetical protein